MKDDSGPAFPCEKKYSEFTKQEEPVGFPGMTLRDWYAGQALAGFCSAGRPINIDGVSMGVCKASYELADAMLAKRNK